MIGVERQVAAPRPDCLPERQSGSGLIHQGRGNRHETHSSRRRVCRGLCRRAGARRRARRRLRPRRQVRQVLQRGGLQRRREVQGRDRHRLSRVRDRRTTPSASRRSATSPRDGYNPIVAIGFAQAAALETVATEFPDTKFAIVDMVVDLPNVQSIVFKEQEGSYLVGMLAAHGLEDRQGRLRRRHGHPADPQVRLRLCRRASSPSIPTPRSSRT